MHIFFYQFCTLVHSFFLKCYTDHSSNFSNSNSCCSFFNIKAIAKRKTKKISSQSKKSYRNCDCWNTDNNRESNQEKKQRTKTTNVTFWEHQLYFRWLHLVRRWTLWSPGVKRVTQLLGSFCAQNYFCPF